MRININKYCSALGSILLSAFLFSCTDEIDITLKNADPKIVVYGSITTDTAAHRIMITQTAGYYSNQPPQTISGATVSITDGTNVFPLTESSTEPGNYYTQPDVYGEIGKTYTLNIDNVSIVGSTEVKSLTAQSTIPDIDPNYQTEYLDSINVLYNEQWEGWYVNGWANEPADQKNYYMFKAYIDNVLYSDSLNNIVVTDDKLINGSTTNGAALYFIEDADTLKAGSNVTLELSVINEDHYYFMYETQTSSQPQIPLFSPPPANARTNISNGAIGYFSAYAIIRSSYIVKQSDIDRKNKLTKKKSGSY
ncbi:hypothetical protein CYCD_22510 [Tenuifilaceae bacterium CYCD]|nr:hypothetical protein CYCD_22510 [Tenuifilaceae bacterium CYCD]